MMKKRMIGKLRVFGVLAGALLLAPPGLAAEDFFAQGRQQMAEQRYDAAYDSYHQAFLANPGHPEVNFLLGRAAFESGRFEEAVMAYERVLMQNPEAARAKLELARTYMQLGSRELARQYFNEVLATNPPEAVWQNIQRFLAAIDAAEKRHFFNGMVTVGVNYDDNVRASAGVDTIDTILGPFPAPAAIADPKSNYLLNTSLVLNHVYRSRHNSPWTWKTTLTNYNALHETAHDMDIYLFGLSTGPTWRRDKLMIQGALLANHVELSADRYLGLYGASANLTWISSPRWAWTGGVTIQDKNFYESSDKDSTNVALSFGPVFSSGANRLTLSLGYESENAALDHFSYDRSRAMLRYDRQLPRDFAAYAAVRYQETKYDAVDPLRGVVRDDESRYFNLGLSKVLWHSGDRLRSVSGQASYGHTDSDSNISDFSHDKNVTSLALTYTF